MTTITIPRALLEQAIKAFSVLIASTDGDVTIGPYGVNLQVKAMNALRAELAKPVEQAEHVASVYVQHFRGMKSMENIDFEMIANLPPGNYKLYLHPPTPAWHDAPTCGAAATEPEPAEQQDDGSNVVWKATNIYGETAHFGVHSAAKAWARSGSVEPVPLKHLRLVPLGTDCGPDCRQCGMTCRRGRQIDEQFAHKLAIDLECLLIDPERNRAAAEKTLAAYRAAWDAINPGPATFMGEPISSSKSLASQEKTSGSPIENYSDCHGPDWRDRDGEYLK